jgi:hypothetical protein
MGTYFTLLVIIGQGEKLPLVCKKTLPCSGIYPKVDAEQVRSFLPASFQRSRFLKRL